MTIFIEERKETERRNKELKKDGKRKRRKMGLLVWSLNESQYKL